MGRLLHLPVVPREGEVSGGPDLVDTLPTRATPRRRKARDVGTLDALITQYTKDRLAAGRIKPATAYGNRLILWLFADSFGNREVSKMGEADVLRFLASIRHHKPATLRTYLGTVKGFTRWLVRKNHLRRDPCLDLRPPKQPRSVPKVFEAWEIAAVLDVCKDARQRLIILLGVQMGLRVGEIATVELGDFGPMLAHVVGKGDHEREVPVPREVRRALDDYLRERGRWAGPLIENQVRRGTGMRSQSVGQLVRRLCIEAGVKTMAFDGKSAHGLRRTGATDMADRGHPVEKVAQVLGHKNTRTTEDFYTRKNSRGLMEVVEGREYGRQALEDVG